MARTTVQPKGNITLIVVFVTSMIAFLFVSASYMAAAKERESSTRDVHTEQAFYSAESCLEDALLRLRTDPSFTAAEIQTDSIRCSVSTSAEPTATFGTIQAQGMASDSIRSVSSQYADAGPSESRQPIAVYHIIDRSGSMADDGYGCTLTEYLQQPACVQHGGVWGMQPITTTKEAAKMFVDQLDPAYDSIGVISYNSSVTLHLTPTNNFPQVKTAIQQIPNPSDYTNIGDAFAMATSHFPTDERTHVEILLTDGKANRPQGLNAETYALQKANEAKQQGIIVVTIGLGNDINESLLSSAASTLDGNNMYYHAPAAQDLQNIYQDIAQVLITYNLKQTSWQEE